MKYNPQSVLDRERLCARCKKRAAVIRFDRDEVCVFCYQLLDAELLREGERQDEPAKNAGAIRR